MTAQKRHLLNNLLRGLKKRVRLTVPPPRKGWRYSAFSELFLDYGREFSFAPFTESELLILAQIPRRPYPIKECFNNATAVMTYAHPKSHLDGLRYCEGFVMTPTSSFPVSHAWVSLNSKPIDVTLRKDWEAPPTRGIKKLLQRIEENAASNAYFGVEIPYRVLLNGLGRDNPCILDLPSTKYLKAGLPWASRP